MEPGASFSFKLTGKSGAALVTRYEAYREDNLDGYAFEQYTKKHYDSWVTFACDKGYSGDVKPVLVSGFDMTKDFAMTAYSNSDASFESNLSISVPTRVPTSTFFFVEGTSVSAHTNRGPQQYTPPDTSSEPTSAGAVSGDYNQCVFLRYYTMRKRMGLFPILIRPVDLGPGYDLGDIFPELIARQHPPPNHEDAPTSGDEEQGLIVHSDHLTSGPQNAKSGNPGDLTAQNSINLSVAERSQMPEQGYSNAEK